MKRQLQLLGLFWAVLLTVVDVLGQKTTLVKDINPGVASGIENLDDYAIMNNILFFPADNGTDGKELWRTDGSPAGTYIVRKIGQNPKIGSRAKQLYVHNGSLFFWADDNADGKFDLWKTDGTSNGTALVKNFSENAQFGSLIVMHAYWGVVDNKLQFTFRFKGEIWETDGTSIGTRKLVTIPIRPDPIGGSTGKVVNKTWIVQIENPVNEPKGKYSVWRSDGTQVGTFPLYYTSSIPNIPKTNEAIAYINDGGGCWRTDGTVNGTYLKRGIGVNSDDVLLKNNDVYSPNGDKLLKLEDSKSQYSVVYDFKTSPYYVPNGISVITRIVDINSTIYGVYTVLDHTHTKDILFRLNRNTNKIEFINYFTQEYKGTKVVSRTLSPFSDGIYFVSYDEGGLSNQYRINKFGESDTTAQVVTLLTADISQNHPLEVIPNFVPVGRTFFFPSNDASDSFVRKFGKELWKFSLCTHTVDIQTPNGTSFCSGSSVPLSVTISGGTSSYKYKWIYDDGFYVPDENGISSAKETSATKTGTYIVEVADQSGCTVSTSVEIRETTNLPVMVMGSNSICTGMSSPLSATVLGGTAPYTYQWKQNSNNVTGATSSTLAVTTSGVYSVSITDSKGCTGISSGFSATVKPAPNVTITTSANSLTSGGSLVLTTPAASGQSYQWYKDGQPIAGATNNTYTAKDPGQYTVMVTRNDCSAISQPLRINLILANEPTPITLGLEVSPNPVSQNTEIYLRMLKPAPAIFTLVDAAGRTIWEREFIQPRNLHEFVLPMKLYSSGIYFLRVESNGLKAVRRVLKQ